MLAFYANYLRVLYATVCRTKKLCEAQVLPAGALVSDLAKAGPYGKLRGFGLGFETL